MLVRATSRQSDSWQWCGVNTNETKSSDENNFGYGPAHIEFLYIMSALFVDSKQTLNNPIHLEISLNEATYKAGGNLTGKVNLSVLGNDEVQLANTTIYLTIKGTEFAKHIHFAFEMISDNIVTLRVCIATIPSGRIPPGYYEYPFQCIVPVNWPTSFHFRKQNILISDFGIRYTISVCIQHIDPQNRASLKCFATESLMITALAVTEFPLDNTPSYVVEPEFFPIQSFCFFKGSMLLGFDTSSTSIVPNTVVQIGILGKNLSVVDVQYFKVELVESMNWGWGGGLACLCKKIIANTNIGASPAWDCLGKVAISKGHHRYTNPTLSELEASRVQGCLRVPYDTMESYQGQIIQITHTILITAVLTASFIKVPPCLSISVQVKKCALSETNTNTLNDIDFLANTSHNDLPTAMAHVVPQSLSPQTAELLSVSSDSNPEIATNNNLESSPLEGFQEDLQAQLIPQPLSYGPHK